MVIVTMVTTYLSSKVVRFVMICIFFFFLLLFKKKNQAVNKLAEILNRKEVRGNGSRRGNDTDVKRKEKENRKLQLELRSEREKLNSTIIKYQREINEMQAVRLRRQANGCRRASITSNLTPTT